MRSTKIWSLELGMARAFAIRGEDGIILVDCGYNGPSLETGMVKAGIDPGKLSLVIITHAHNDHFGGLPWLSGQRKGLPVAVGTADADALERGRNADLLPLGQKGRFAARLSKGEQSFPSFPATLCFSGGESLEPYGMDAQVIATPGHTRGSISIVLPSAEDVKGKTLGCAAIVGDLVMGGFVFHGRAQAPFFASSREDIAASLDALRKRGVTLLFTGHGGPIKAEKAYRKFGLD